MTKSGNPHEAPQHESEDQSPGSRGMARRDLMKMPLALAAGSLVVPWLSGTSEAKNDKNDDKDDKHDDKDDKKKKGNVALAPNYYPVHPFKPQIKLPGKLAVITGASRGIGRAIGEALRELDVDVIGTSRDPDNVPNPPDFPLLALDISDPLSVLAFVGELQSHPLVVDRGQVDILVNNAARFVVGRIVPQPENFPLYLAERDLGVRTVYSGHVTVTNAMLPLLPQQGYARIIFTVSISGYISAALLPVGSFQDVYAAGKAALRVYANNLDGALSLIGSNIRVSTLNPYFVNTTGIFHPNPIYTQPVNGDGLSDTDSVFNSAITALRGLQANGLPPSMVGEACAQLLRMNDPDQNIVVASPNGILADKGANDIIEPELLAENLVSAIPFSCG